MWSGCHGYFLGIGKSPYQNYFNGLFWKNTSRIYLQSNIKCFCLYQLSYLYVAILLHLSDLKVLVIPRFWVWILRISVSRTLKHSVSTKIFHDHACFYMIMSAFAWYSWGIRRPALVSELIWHKNVFFSISVTIKPLFLISRCQCNIAMKWKILNKRLWKLNRNWEKITKIYLLIKLNTSSQAVT